MLSYKLTFSVICYDGIQHVHERNVLNIGILEFMIVIIIQPVLITLKVHFI